MARSVSLPAKPTMARRAMPGRSAGRDAGSAERRAGRSSRVVAEEAMVFSLRTGWLPGNGLDEAKLDDEGEGEREGYGPGIEGEDAACGCGHKAPVVKEKWFLHLAFGGEYF